MTEVPGPDPRTELVCAVDCRASRERKPEPLAGDVRLARWSGRCWPGRSGRLPHPSLGVPRHFGRRMRLCFVVGPQDPRTEPGILLSRGRATSTQVRQSKMPLRFPSKTMSSPSSHEPLALAS